MPTQKPFEPGLFINLIGLFLTPYFLDITPDGRLAQSDIVETLETTAPAPAPNSSKPPGSLP